MVGFCLLGVCLDACSPHAAQEDAVALHWSSLADLLIDRVQLQPGEKVVMVAAPGRFDALIDQLRDRVTARGGLDLGVISVAGERPSWQSEFVNQAAELDDSSLVEYLRVVDLGIMMPGATADDRPYAAMQEVLKKGQGRTVHFHWAGAYDLNQNAIDITARVDTLYQQALLQTDYADLAAKQRSLEAAMRLDTVRVTTPAGTDVKFWIGDRPLTKQDGDASAVRMQEARNLIDREIELPAGAIRVAPLEASMHGIITFPDARWGGVEVQGLRMEFEAGKLIAFEASAGREGVEKELEEAGVAARSFREFALGLNPLLAIPPVDPWIPYYGYGAGVVRLSLGDNSELGGAVGGNYVRWNFFPDATVVIGSEVWVRDGKLLK